MGRGFIVEESVEGYLSQLCEKAANPMTGLLIGQSSSQRDYIIMATQTPQSQESTSAPKSFVDKEWVTEHARQVSRMLPCGLSVLGIFIITDSDAKDTLTTLRQLSFALKKLISSEHLWLPDDDDDNDDDDVTECVTLHINPKTRKTICRTFDVKDPKSVAKPAEWKYQSGVYLSWSTVSCSLNVDLLLPLPENKALREQMDTCLKEGLKDWARQIQKGVCLIDGKWLPEDAELTGGQKRNMRQTHTAQLLITADDQRLTDVVQQSGGSLSVRGAIHSRVYLHSNKPKARLAEMLLKRDIVSTVAIRVHMLLEELLISEEEDRGSSKVKQEHFSLPRRIFYPVNVPGPVCVCEYQFSDEGQAELIDRLKEMLDIDATENDLDTRQEISAEIRERDVLAVERGQHVAGGVSAQQICSSGVAMAAAVAVVATVASVLYLNHM